MDAQDFVELFKNEELKVLLAAYRKMAEPLEYIDSLPRIETKHYSEPPVTDTEPLRRQVMERQAALDAYLLRVMENPAVQTLMDGAPLQDAMDY